MDGSNPSRREFQVAKRTDADFRALASAAPMDCTAANDVTVLLDRGQVALDGALLRRLRQGRLLSQQDLADECWRRNIRVSIATIKRAESGRAVRFRIARELARCFEIPVMRIIRLAPSVLSDCGSARSSVTARSDMDLIPA